MESIETVWADVQEYVGHHYAVTSSAAEDIVQEVIADPKAYFTDLLLSNDVSAALVLESIAIGIAIFYILTRVWDIATKRDVTDPTNLPPMVPHTIPFIGSMIEFGIHPIKFMIEKRQKYGDCFTFLMWGRKMTYCLGPDGNYSVFNAKLRSVSAEDAYNSLTRPVFGPGVVYDVENSKFMEQKRMAREAFSNDSLRKDVGFILEESIQYLREKMIDKDSPSKLVNLVRHMSQITIRTTSRCLLGSEIRQRLDDKVAVLVADLDKGFSPLAFLFHWLPLPVFFKRDRAHRELSKFFQNVIHQRIKSGDFGSRDGNHDMIAAMLASSYRDGSKMSEQEIAHILIAALMGGQHSSSTTLIWILSYIACDKALYDALLQEQQEILNGRSENLSYDNLKKMPILDSCFRESLRLHPPLIQLIRLVKEDVQFNGHRIPKGHYICASPAVAHLDEVAYNDPHKFIPGRWLERDSRTKMMMALEKDIGEDYGWGPVTGSARSHYLPFGAGRHRCIGEYFANIQIKTILTVILENFELSLEGPFPTSDYSSMFVMTNKDVPVKFTLKPGSMLTTALCQVEHA